MRILLPGVVFALGLLLSLKAPLVLAFQSPSDDLECLQKWLPQGFDIQSSELKDIYDHHPAAVREQKLGAHYAAEFTGAPVDTDTTTFEMTKGADGQDVMDFRIWSHFHSAIWGDEKEKRKMIADGCQIWAQRGLFPGDADHIQRFCVNPMMNISHEMNENLASFMPQLKRAAQAAFAVGGKNYKNFDWTKQFQGVDFQLNQRDLWRGDIEYGYNYINKGWAESRWNEARKKEKKLESLLGFPIPPGSSIGSQLVTDKETGKPMGLALGIVYPDHKVRDFWELFGIFAAPHPFTSGQPPEVSCEWNKLMAAYAKKMGLGDPTGPNSDCPPI